MSKPLSATAAAVPKKKKSSASSWLLPLCCRLLTAANVSVPISVPGILDVSGLVAVLEDKIEEQVAGLVVRNPEIGTAVAAVADLVDDVSGAPAALISAAQVVLEVTTLAAEILPLATAAPVTSPSPDSVVAEPKSQDAKSSESAQ